MKYPRLSIIYKSVSGHGVSSWPAVFGTDGAGVVEAVGAEVYAFKKGDEVLARFDPAVPASAAFQVSRFATMQNEGYASIF